MWWWIGGGAAGLLLLCCLVTIALIPAIRRTVSGVAQSVGEAQNTATGYFEAIEAHDWATAQTYLSSSLRSTTTPASLETVWTRREAANGAIDRFEATNTNIRTFRGTGGNQTTATVTGTLHYRTGVSEPKVVTLVNEGNDWKLSALP